MSGRASPEPVEFLVLGAGPAGHKAAIQAAKAGRRVLIADPSGRLAGAHVVGEAATELVHAAQMALVGKLSLEAFVENVFNFPTMAEAYRVAAIDAVTRMGTTQRRDAA